MAFCIGLQRALQSRVLYVMIQDLRICSAKTDKHPSLTFHSQTCNAVAPALIAGKILNLIAEQLSDAEAAAFKIQPWCLVLPITRSKLATWRCFCFILPRTVLYKSWLLSFVANDPCRPTWKTRRNRVHRWTASNEWLFDKQGNYKLGYSANIYIL